MQRFWLHELYFRKVFNEGRNNYSTAMIYFILEKLRIVVSATGIWLNGEYKDNMKSKIRINN